MELEKIWEGWKTEELISKNDFGSFYTISREINGKKISKMLCVTEIPQNKDENDLKRYGKNLEIFSKIEDKSHLMDIEEATVVPDSQGSGWKACIRTEPAVLLADYTEKHEITEKETIQLGMEICEALAICRKHHIVYEKITYDDIFVTPNHEIRLGYFRFSHNEKVFSSVPEGMDMTEEISSVGYIMYRLLNDNRLPDMAHNGKGELPPPVNAGEKLAGIILKACEKNYYESFDSFRKDLSELPILSFDIMREIEFKNNGKSTKSDFRRIDKRIIYGVGAGAAVLMAIGMISMIPRGDKTGSQEETEKQVTSVTKEKVSPKEKVIVPALKNMNIEEARKVLHSQGLQVDVSYENSKDVEKDFVISQDVNEGTEVEKGSIVHIVVCHAKILTVPDVSDKVMEEARGILETMGLNVKIKKDFSDTVKTGYVISQLPEKNQEVEEGKSIELTVSKGIELIKIPDLTGLKKNEAKTKLEKLGLKAVFTQAYSNWVEEGKVVSQSMDKSKMVKKGTKIEVEISKGPEPEPETTVVTTYYEPEPVENDTTQYIPPQTTKRKEPETTKNIWEGWEIIDG